MLDMLDKCAHSLSLLPALGYPPPHTHTKGSMGGVTFSMLDAFSIGSQPQ